MKKLIILMFMIVAVVTVCIVPSYSMYTQNVNYSGTFEGSITVEEESVYAILWLQNQLVLNYADLKYDYDNDGIVTEDEINRRGDELQVAILFPPDKKKFMTLKDFVDSSSNGSAINSCGLNYGQPLTAAMAGFNVPHAATSTWRIYKGASNKFNFFYTSTIITDEMMNSGAMIEYVVRYSYQDDLFTYGTAPCTTANDGRNGICAAINAGKYEVKGIIDIEKYKDLVVDLSQIK